MNYPWPVCVHCGASREDVQAAGAYFGIEDAMCCGFDLQTAERHSPACEEEATGS